MVPFTFSDGTKVSSGMGHWDEGPRNAEIHTEKSYPFREVGDSYLAQLPSRCIEHFCQIQYCFPNPLHDPCHIRLIYLMDVTL